MPVADVKKPVAKSSVGGRRRESIRIGRALTRAHNPPRLCGADAKYRRGRPLRGNVEIQQTAGSGRDYAQGNATGKTIWRDVVTVVAGEAVAPIVERMAKLASARNGLERRAVCLKAEVATPYRYWFGFGARSILDRTAVAAGYPINPAIRAPEQTVQKALDILGAEAAEHHLLDIGNSVARGILGIENVRSNGDEHAVVVGNNSGRPRKPAQEDRPSVELAIAVAVFETADAA